MIKLYIVIFLNLFLASRSFAHGFIRGVLTDSGMVIKQHTGIPSLVTSVANHSCNAELAPSRDVVFLTCQKFDSEENIMIAAKCLFENQRVQTLILEDDKGVRHYLSVFCNKEEE